MALLIFTRTVGSALVFELHGALDAASADKLAAEVNEALDAGHRLLIFDLSRVSYVSSTGLGVFLAAYRRLPGTGHVRFAGLQPPVRQLFNVSALTALVEIYDTLEDAVVGPRP